MLDYINNLSVYYILRDPLENSNYREWMCHALNFTTEFTHVSVRRNDFGISPCIVL